MLSAFTSRPLTSLCVSQSITDGTCMRRIGQRGAHIHNPRGRDKAYMRIAFLEGEKMLNRMIGIPKRVDVLACVNTPVNSPALQQGKPRRRQGKRRLTNRGATPRCAVPCTHRCQHCAMNARNTDRQSYRRTTICTLCCHHSHTHTAHPMFAARCHRPRTASAPEPALSLTPEQLMPPSRQRSPETLAPARQTSWSRASRGWRHSCRRCR